jgi:hypothetical protein
MADDRAFPRPPRRVTKTFTGVHRGTLLPTREGRDPPRHPFGSWVEGLELPRARVGAGVFAVLRGIAPVVNADTTAREL